MYISNFLNFYIMLVPILLGSESDKDHAKKITDVLDKFEVSYEIIVASAHKVPEKVFEIVKKYNDSDENIVYVTIAGRSNGLSGVVGANSIHPVIACPPFKDKSDYLVNIHSTLQMPSDTPTLAVLEPKNAAMSAIRILALSNEELKDKLKNHLAEIKDKF